jgi:AcrR family transcriptional regulator
MTRPPEPATWTTPPTARQRQAAATRDRILGAALELFARDGYSATSTREIASQAGVSEGLIFHHYPSKLDLLRAIPRGRSGVAGRILELTMDPDSPVEEVVGGITRAFVEQRQAQRDMLRMIFTESRHDEDLRQISQAFLGGSRDALESYLKARMERGEVRTDVAAREAGSAFLDALIAHLITSERRSDDAWRATAGPYARVVADIWVRGLRVPSEPHRHGGAEDD